MANVVPYSFGKELFSAGHAFQNGSGVTYNLALYTANNYTTASTVYSTGVAGQVGTGGTNYATGGKPLQSQAVDNQTNVATVDFADLPWPSATFSAAFGVIYRVDNDKLVVILDFGGTKTATNGTFTVSFPAPDSGTPAGSDAILSITS